MGDESTSTAVVWLRRDLRVRDNAALAQATRHHDRVIAIYIHHPLDQWSPGAASLWWLHHSLNSLATELDGQLFLRIGEPLSILRDVASTEHVSAVYWNRCYEPAEISRDKAIKTALTDDGLQVSSHNALLCNEPWQIETQSGTPYRVFTPYYKVWRKSVAINPVDESTLDLTCLVEDPAPVRLDELKLLPKIPWDAAFPDFWTPGEAGALTAVEDFRDVVESYASDRDRCDREGTSRLSPHLHFGEIAPWRIVAMLDGSDGAAAFVRELAWREFSCQLLYYFPETTDQPLNDKFEKFPWREDEEHLKAWQDGRTGIPIVDAGMRQLWQTGWMHNRVRMIVGSFLTKNLRLHWSHGARWFFDTLVDADLANNTQGWQWIAGCGADAAPYFRVFNPLLQAERYDPEALYIKRWVPELESLKPSHAHAPFDAPQAALKAANVELGVNYPQPLVDLKDSRDQALAAYQAMKDEFA